MDNSSDPHGNAKVSILSLLKRLWPDPEGDGVTAIEIANAVSHIFTDSLTQVQAGALLTCLHFTGWDRRADVLSRCSQVMRDAAAQPDRKAIADVIEKQSIAHGSYAGGLCDIVGTGGDGHNTYNVSTTSSIVASAYLRMAKHGNRGSTSNSGSADLLQSVTPLAPILQNVEPRTLADIYRQTNYAFLYAPVFHPGMKYVAPIRKELGWRTIFNLLGPLSNPLDAVSTFTEDKPDPRFLEARVIGVARQDVGHTFAEALQKNGNRKGLVVCGAEEMDELSPSGETHCWMLVGKTGNEIEVDVEYFKLHPDDFGLPTFALKDVSPGKGPHENAAILQKLLSAELAEDDPILNWVVMNTAALLVVSGVCDADEDGTIQERGPGGGRWKEGVRKAGLAIQTGKAKEQWDAFVKATHIYGSK